MRTLQLSPSGSSLLAAGHSAATMIELATSTEHPTLFEGAVSAAAWIDDDRDVVGTTHAGAHSVIVASAGRGTMGPTLPCQRRVEALHPDPVARQRLLVITQGRHAVLWDVETCHEIRLAPDDPRPLSRDIACGGWAADGRC